MHRRRATRWAVVLVVMAVLATLPYAIGRLPAGASTISAPTLLQRVQSSANVAYSGYAESTGALGLPVTTGQFGSISDLLGSTTDLRVWWHSDRDWRVDALNATGESDLTGTGSDLWAWNYEANTADSQIGAASVAARVPRVDDLVPANLARRLLTQATSAEVARIGSARVAGKSAAGLRYTPDAPQSTIGRIDVWALPGSGLPLRVRIYGKGASTPVLSTTMLDVSLGTPPPSATAFLPTLRTNAHSEQAPDILSLARGVDRASAPAELGGLARDPIVPSTSGAWTYGSGVTVLVAIPLDGRTGYQLRDQLSKAAGATVNTKGVAITVGPLNLLVTAGVPVNVQFNNQYFTVAQGSFLLVGTVTQATLTRARTEIAAEQQVGGLPILLRPPR